MGTCYSAPSSSDKEAPIETSRNREYSFHENLVLQRFGRERFDKMYENLDEIGRGGLCTVYKIQKRHVDGRFGPARRFLKRNSLRRDKARIPEDSDSEKEEAVSDTSNKTTPPQTTTTEYKNNTYFALKVINLAMVQEDKIGSLKNEVEILKTLDHKNIIKGRGKKTRQSTKLQKD